MTSTATVNPNGPTILPGLYSARSGTVIILCETASAGMVVASSDAQLPIGSYSPSWNTNDLKAWGGTITITS